MRVILTHDFTHGIGGFLARLVAVVSHLVHAVQHTAVNGLHAVADVRQGARHYHRHRIVDVGRLHFVFDIDLKDAIFFQHSI